MILKFEEKSVSSTGKVIFAAATIAGTISLMFYHHNALTEEKSKSLTLPPLEVVSEASAEIAEELPEDVEHQEVEHHGISQKERDFLTGITGGIGDGEE